MTPPASQRQPPPPHLTYESHSYLTVSTSAPSLLVPFQPSSPSNSSPSNSQILSPSTSDDGLPDLHTSLEYVGPVGVLDSKHIYSVPVPSENPPRPEVQEVRRWLQRIGVKNVDIMVPKQRRVRGP